MSQDLKLCAFCVLEGGKGCMHQNRDCWDSVHVAQVWWVVVTKIRAHKSSADWIWETYAFYLKQNIKSYLICVLNSVETCFHIPTLYQRISNQVWYYFYSWPVPCLYVKNLITHITYKHCNVITSLRKYISPFTAF